MIKYYVLLITSVLGLIFGLTINPQVMDLLGSAVEQVYSGHGLRNYMDPVLGIMASGKVKLISPWLVKLILISSMIGIYVASFKISHKNTESKLSDVFTLRYWSHIDWGFRYKPVRIFKK